MRTEVIVDLADCTESADAMQARVPRFVHGAIFLLVALLGTAAVWAAVTDVHLVVRATGRVRSVTAPFKLASSTSGQSLTAGDRGRVVAVNFREGDVVREGDALIQLETTSVDNAIAKQKLRLQAAEEELGKLGDLQQLMSQQFAEMKARAEAELSQVTDQLTRARERQDVDKRVAQIDVESARDEETRQQQLAEYGLVSAIDRAKASNRRQQAEEKLKQVSLPVDAGHVEVMRPAVTRIEKDYALQLEDVALKRRARQAERDAAKVDLSNLERERQQAVMRAPIDGLVTRGDVKIGDILADGSPVVEIAAQKKLGFEAAVPNDEIARLRVGMTARIRLDAYDSSTFGTIEGQVTFIAPDSDVVDRQRVPTYVVRITLTSDEVGRGARRGPVKLGMAGQAEIVTGRESLLSVLLRQIRQTVSLG